MTATKRFLLLLGVLCCYAWTAMAQIPPTSIFQLDGEVAPNSNYPNCTKYVDKSISTTPATLLGPTVCDTWSLLNGTGSVGPVTGGASDHWLVRSFNAAGQGGLAYAQGSKDIANPAGGWHYSSNPTPDKDTLENVYAAAYTGGSQKDLMLVFGAERNSVSGDANIGIWFFQQDVHPDPSSNNFVGNHVNNDVFLVSSFTNGGTIPTIGIYIWNSACSGADQAFVSNNPPASPDKVCASKNVEWVTSKSSLCATVTSPGGSVSGVSGASACAVTNQFPLALPWPSAVKAPAACPAGTPVGTACIPAQTFFTGGIDLTDIFKNVLGVTNLPCFTSFLMDTRTSQSLGATLKDFLGGKFPLCGVSITKACQCDRILNNGIPLPGDTSSSYEYQVSGSVTNTGFGDLSSVTVADKNLTFNCGTLSAGATKLWGNGATASDCQPAAANPTCVDVANGDCFKSTLKPEANTATVTATPPGGGTNLTATYPATGTVACPAAASLCNPNPGVSPSKCCSVTVTSSAQLEVDYNGRVTNSGNEALTSLTVQDALITNVSGTLTTGAYGSNLTLSHYSTSDTVCGGLGKAPCLIETCTSCTVLPNDYVTFSGLYDPSGANAADLATNSGSATFRDRLKVTAIRPDTGATITNTDQTATCTISLGQACQAP